MYVNVAAAALAAALLHCSTAQHLILAAPFVQHRLRLFHNKFFQGKYFAL